MLHILMLHAAFLNTFVMDGKNGAAKVSERLYVICTDEGWSICMTDKWSICMTDEYVSSERRRDVQ